MSGIFRSWFCLMQFCLLIGATPVWASICAQIQDLERLEAVTGLLIEERSNSDVAPAVATTLDAIFSQTRILQDSTFQSEDLEVVTSQYAASMASIHQQLTFRGPVRTAELLTRPDHRRLLRRMVAVSHDACSFEINDKRQSNDGVTGGSRGFSILPDISVPYAIFGASALIAGLVFGSYLTFLATNLRKNRRKRYLCNYTVTVIGVNGRHMDLQMLDVSGMGAKLRFLENQSLDAALQVKIGQRTLKARVAWKNAHYAGILFQSPLSLKFVKKISKGVAERTGKTSRNRQRPSKSTA